MKHAKGAGGMSGEANEDDFQVVPVESTSEYEKHLYVRCLAGDRHLTQILTFGKTAEVKKQ